MKILKNFILSLTIHESVKNLKKCIYENYMDSLNREKGHVP